MKAEESLKNAILNHIHGFRLKHSYDRGLSQSRKDDPRRQLYDTIVSGICPDCGLLDSMVLGPCGGACANIICEKCKCRYWITTIRELGAEKLSPPAQ